MDVSWQEMGSIFQQVYDLPVDERALLLDRLCPESSPLRAEVESLLRAHDLAEELTESGHSVSVGELSPTAMVLAPDRRLGSYTVLRELGQGGMSTVFLAARTDDEFDRLVAIKTLRSLVGDEGYERFRAERQTHAGLEHPGIARLYGGGTTEQGVPYIVMEYVEDGEPIDRFCDLHELDAEARIHGFREVCDAVAYAHHNLVVHRDLKPSNILVTPEGEPKLLDFGIAKLLTPEGADWDPTRDGPGPLTPAYAGPEQLLGEPITTASDVFSLGVLLFRLLTGRLPHARSLNERLGELKDDRPIPTLERTAREEGGPSARAFLALDRGRRHDLQAIVAKALHREPSRRYASVDQLDEDLRRWQQGLPVSARLPTARYRLTRWMRRNRLVAGFGATVALTLLASSLILAGQTRVVSAERDRARDAALQSERMLSLLIGLLESSDPARAQGSDLSVRDVLLAAEPRIERELSSRPAVQAELFETVGRVFLSLDDVDQAERLVDRALALRRDLPEHEALAGTLDLRAQVHIQRGAFAEALELLGRARELRRRLLGPGSAEEASGLARMAYAHLLLYQEDESEAAAREALELFREHGDAGFEEERIDARFNLGEALHRRGGKKASKSIFEDLLADAETTLGPRHPMTLSILGKLADLEAEHPADYELAERYARRKIDTLREIYPGDHGDLAVSLDVLASILARKGDLDQAVAVSRECIDMRRRLVGEEDPFLAVSLGNLGWLHLFRRHDPQTAEPILRQALAMAETFFPPDATLLTYPLIGIGRCRVLAGAPAEGEPFLRRAVDIRRRARGPDDLSTARAELFLGESLAAQGLCEEAGALLSRSRPALEAAAEPDDLIRMAAPLRIYEQKCEHLEPGRAAEP